MAAETINVDTTIAELEVQFADQHLTMLDVLGVEIDVPESTEQPLAPTATAITDYIVKNGDSF